MTPLYFGSPQRRLFGIYAPASAAARRTRAIVLCPPWGQEYLRAHRSLRQLALRLSAAGFHVLRFDYFGTGDSAGDLEDAGLPGWEADIESAIEELKDMSGAQRVGLVGLRLGATLAARVCTRQRRQIDSLVLWDPVLDGAAHIEELLSLDAALSGQPAPRPRPEGRPGWQLLGFALTPTLREQIAQAEALSLVASWPARSLVITSGPVPSLAALREALAQRGQGGAELEHLESEPAWLEHRSSGAGAIPVALLDRLVGWCAA